MGIPTQPRSQHDFRRHPWPLASGCGQHAPDLRHGAPVLQGGSGHHRRGLEREEPERKQRHRLRCGGLPERSNDLHLEDVLRRPAVSWQADQGRLRPELQDHQHRLVRKDRGRGVREWSSPASQEGLPLRGDSGRQGSRPARQA